MMKKTTFHRSLSALLVAGIASLGLAACSSSTNQGASPSTSASSPDANAKFDQKLFDLLPESVQDSKTIKVANPFGTSWVRLESDAKTLTGPVPDISVALEPILGVKFDWTQSPFPDLIPGLQSGKFDMIWGSISESPERFAIMNMVSYAQQLNALLVLAGNPKNITDVDDSLCGHNAGTQSGSLQLEALQAQAKKCADGGKPKLTVLAYDSVPASLVALRSEKIDAFYGTQATIIQLTQQQDQKGVFEQVGELHPDSRSALGVSLEDPDFAKAMQGALQKLIESGEYTTILKKYDFQDMGITADQVLINGQ